MRGYLGGVVVVEQEGEKRVKDVGSAGEEAVERVGLE